MRHKTRRSPPRLVLAAVVGVSLLLGVAPAAHAAFGFTPYGALNTNAATDKGQDYNPAVAGDGAGTWIAVWRSNGTAASAIGSEGDLFYAVSTDNGETWSGPETLNTNATTDTMEDPEPVIACDGSGHWIVAWASQENLGGTIGTDWDILYAVSSNDGATWSAPAALNTNAATDSNTDQSPAIACDKNGHWTVVWLTYDSLGGTIGNDGDILVARSTNNGTTWTAPAALNTNAASDSAADAFPCIASNGAGTWVAAWQISNLSGGGLGSDSDVLSARSTDNGATWSDPVPVNDNAASDDTDEFNVSLAGDSTGMWSIVCTRYEQTVPLQINVCYTVSGDDGVSWGSTNYLTTDGSDGTSNDFARIAAGPDGTWMVVWEAWRGMANTLGKDSDILVSLSSDSGMSWAPPSALKTNAPKDDGNDWSPCIASDGLEHWVAVWSSKDTLGDTIGKDADIFVSSTEYPQPVRILKPNGGEAYTRGVTKKMTWTSLLPPSEPVRIELWRNGAFVHRVDKSTPNDGRYNLTFPPQAEPGGGYTMRVILNNFPDAFDDSDAPFKVK